MQDLLIPASDRKSELSCIRIGGVELALEQLSCDQKSD
ncbi:hypothetical protein GGP69_001209 [Salinibacter ruber]|nr:hypothetical protein [Salinibacter ruber]